jgi:hypothetical protein
MRGGARGREEGSRQLAIGRFEIGRMDREKSNGLDCKTNVICPLPPVDSREVVPETFADVLVAAHRGGQPGVKGGFERGRASGGILLEKEADELFGCEGKGERRRKGKQKRKERGERIQWRD